MGTKKATLSPLFGFVQISADTECAYQTVYNISCYLRKYAVVFKTLIAMRTDILYWIDLTWITMRLIYSKVNKLPIAHLYGYLYYGQTYFDKYQLNFFSVRLSHCCPLLKGIFNSQKSSRCIVISAIYTRRYIHVTIISIPVHVTNLISSR